MGEKVVICWQMLVCLTIVGLFDNRKSCVHRGRDQWLVSKPERGYVATTNWGRQPLLTEAMPVPHWGLIHNWGLHRLRVSETTRPFLGRPAQPGHHLPTQALSPFCTAGVNATPFSSLPFQLSWNLSFRVSLIDYDLLIRTPFKSSQRKWIRITISK